jgi:segregation and condensation protein A
MAYKVRLEVFEGPLDLLLHLIEKAQMDIYDIPIAMITEQYLEYIRDMQQFDMEIASEFLVMAATLLQIKSRMLLPKPPKISEVEEETDLALDPRQELVQRLIEYKQFKHAAEILASQQQRQLKIYSKPPLKGPWNDQPFPLEGLSIDDLISAFAVMLQGQEELPALIEREEYTVQDKMQEILRRINRLAEGLPFSKLFYSNATRSERIVYFLALLELMRLRMIKVRQLNPFGEIILLKYEPV